jgi:hypothetical protein
MRPSELLRAAKALIAEPDNWTQSHFARTADGTPVDVIDPAACKFCAVGAIERAAVSNGGSRVDYAQALGRLATVCDGNVAAFNDHIHRIHPEVLGAFDAAIVLATSLEAGHA